MNVWRRHSQKQLPDGSQVMILLDSARAYFVAKAPHEHLMAYPMGAFRSVDAAQRWADASFPGGTWAEASHEPLARNLT